MRDENVRCGENVHMQMSCTRSQLTSVLGSRNEENQPTSPQTPRPLATARGPTFGKGFVQRLHVRIVLILVCPPIVSARVRSFWYFLAQELEQELPALCGPKFKKVVFCHKLTHQVVMLAEELLAVLGEIIVRRICRRISRIEPAVRQSGLGSDSRPSYTEG
ncbi:hypothetical protein XANCAGTX0491_003080 [Xanthoria calcicola]